MACEVFIQIQVEERGTLNLMKPGQVYSKSY